MTKLWESLEKFIKRVSDYIERGLWLYLSCHVPFTTRCILDLLAREIFQMRVSSWSFRATVW